MDGWLGENGSKEYKLLRFYIESPFLKRWFREKPLRFCLWAICSVYEYMHVMCMLFFLPSSPRIIFQVINLTAFVVNLINGMEKVSFRFLLFAFKIEQSE